MKKSGRVLLAILIVLISCIAVAAGLGLPLLDRGTLPETAVSDPAASATPPPVALPTAVPSPTTLPPTATSLPAPTAQTIVLLSPAACSPPRGWIQVTVKKGDTLQQLAARHGTTPNLIAVANCLEGADPKVGSAIYVPDVITTATGPTPAGCPPPQGWQAYTVKADDNLYRIGLAHAVSVATLQAANCMGDSTIIRTGQKLYVPDN